MNGWKFATEREGKILMGRRNSVSDGTSIKVYGILVERTACFLWLECCERGRGPEL